VLKHYHIAGRTAKEISQSIERAIDAGTIEPDERLPTIRSLAASLGVSPTTVNAAFAHLRAHGRINGHRRGGSHVLGRVRFQSGSTSHAPAGTRSLLEANPDPAFLPAIKPVVRDAVVERRLYGESRESPNLLRVARRQLRADGVPDAHVAVVSGAMDGIERALTAHLRPGDTIALEDPTYPPYIELARALQLAIVRMPLDDLGVTEAALRGALHAGARAAIFIPRAQNPTGVAFDPRRAAALARILRSAPAVLVIEDDYLGDVATEPLASVAALHARWAYVRSYAKALGPDLRVALLAGDALTVGRVRDRQRLGCGWVSHLLQNTVAALLGDATVMRGVKRASAIYVQRRNALLAALRAQGLDGLGSSGFVVWVPVADESAAVRSAAAAGWAIDGGARYREASAPGVRIAITCLAAADSRTVAAALAAATRESGVSVP
jgi:DNA-binding transcriptional MocR family regulator